MIAPIKTDSTTSAETMHRQFVDHILPVVELHAAIQFRRLKGQDRDDAIQETTAVAWQFFVQAVEQGKDPTEFPHCIADFAARRVRSGRWFAGHSSRDVLSQRAQMQHCFEVHSLDDESCDPTTGWKAAVTQDSKHSSPADTVAFRLDFECWLGMLPQRDRRVAESLAVGDRTGEVARRYQVTPSRISHLRREIHESWERFECEANDGATASECATAAA